MNDPLDLHWSAVAKTPFLKRNSIKAQTLSMLKHLKSLLGRRGQLKNTTIEIIIYIVVLNVDMWWFCVRECHRHHFRQQGKTHLDQLNSFAIEIIGKLSSSLLSMGYIVRYVMTTSSSTWILDFYNNSHRYTHATHILPYVGFWLNPIWRGNKKNRLLACQHNIPMIRYLTFKSKN